MFEDLVGKSALVTGASTGLGHHFGRLLASHGIQVILAARRTDLLDSAAQSIRNDGGQATVVALDVTDSSSVSAAIDGLPTPPDIFINNAGVSGTAAAEKVTEADWDRIVDTNLKGAFLVAQAAARRWQAAGAPGVIVNIGSVLGLRVAGHVAPYAASKAALVQLTRSLGLEWARHRIRVNALCPGYIETDLNRAFFASDAGQALIRRIPQRRLGRPEDLDAPLLLLCSDAGSYITGTTLAVDGGHLVSSL